MASWEIARIITQRGIKLQGIYVDVGSDTSILYIHGLSGNYYENEFIDILVKAAVECGVNFLSGNTHGSGVIKFLGTTTEEEIIGGSAFELRSHILEDIEAWYMYLQQKKIKKVILAGHSLGTVKTTYYLLHRNPPIKTTKLVLLAAVDYWYIGISNEIDRKAKIKEAKSYPNKKDFVPKEWLSEWHFLLSYESFIDWFSEESDIDIFPFLHMPITNHWKALGQLQVPVVLIQGETDEAIGDVSRSILFFENHINNIKTYTIPEADHWYQGKFEELERILIEALKPKL